MEAAAQDFLFRYLDNNSPTGYEAPGQQLWLDYIRPYIDTHFTDTYGTAVGVVNPEAEYKVVIEAHADEISWYVNYINDDGYIYVRRNGGSDHQIAPSMRVVVHTPQGKVKGVFGWPAIHTRLGEPAKEEKPTMKNIFIDCGFNSKAEAISQGVNVGCVVTFDAGHEILNDRYITGRALDNRLGGFVIAEVLRQLHESGKKLPFGLYAVNSVQEEVGLRGAEMIARRIRPNAAIVTDVCHDTQSPMYDKDFQGDLKAGRGPVLTYAPAVHRNLLELIREAAQETVVPYQRATASRATGTDTDAFAYSGEGIPSALISIPLKYMHTTVETAHKDDVLHAVKLIYESLLRIENGRDFSYIK